MSDLRSEGKGSQPKYTLPDADIDMDAPESGLVNQGHDSKGPYVTDEVCNQAIQYLREAAEKISKEEAEQADAEMEDAPEDSAEEDSSSESSDADADAEDEEDSDEEYGEPVVKEGVPWRPVLYTNNLRKNVGPNQKVATQAPPKSRCDICGDAMAQCKVSVVPCGHTYCSECIERLFETCIANQDMFPPRCCRQPVEIDLVEHLMPQGLLSKYYDRKLELESMNILYCCKPNCSALIPIENMRDGRGKCPKCGTELCVFCRFESHGTDDCPEDWELHDFLDYAAEKGWARCDACGRVIERDFGCNHMV